jgi:glycosyltransferase involved in cell wall biosynthesis
MSPSVNDDLLSIVIPAYNEGNAIVPVLESLKAVLEKLPCLWEVLVVDDGSKDDTAAKAASVPGVTLVQNPVNLGYGHTLLRGISAAQGNLIAIIDADATYPVSAIPDLYAMIQKGSDHAIGQRTGKNFGHTARDIYRFLCRYVVGQNVPDANSGLRIFRREIVQNLRGDLCLGFSFTTSLTLASIMTGYVVTFVEIPYEKRIGKSHVKLRDVLRTIQYLFQLVAVYNPLKLFLPMIVLSMVLALSGYAYGVIRASENGFLAGMLMTATSFLLVGLAGHAFIVSRTGLFPVRTTRDFRRSDAAPSDVGAVPREAGLKGGPKA